tara:strand:+ start:1037 stop:1234 length:198 start_codon:yes stop_codon:yes gene_type:complete
MTRLEELKAVWKAADAAYYAAKDDADADWAAYDAAWVAAYAAAGAADDAEDAYYTELKKQGNTHD